jgi:C4-dicarboxylate-specific signal transduction histidine kinase
MPEPSPFPILPAGVRPRNGLFPLDLGSSDFLMGGLDARKLVQELQLHKIELEMQNEELQRIQQELEDSWRQIDHLVAERTRKLAGAVAELTGEAQRRRQAEAALRAACAEIERLRRQAQSPHDQEYA